MVGAGMGEIKISSNSILLNLTEQEKNMFYLIIIPFRQEYFCLRWKWLSFKEWYKIKWIFYNFL
jgi:hypothetical protein